MAEVVTPFSGGLSRATAERVIRSLAADTGKCAWSAHFIESMVEREVSMRQVLTTLREGRVVSDPVRNEFGDWRCAVRKRCAGQRVTVIIAIQGRERLIGVTTY